MATIQGYLESNTILMCVNVCVSMSENGLLLNDIRILLIIMCNINVKWK